MRRSSLVLVAVTLLAVVGTSFYSQGQPQNQPPRPARSRADETLAMWNEIGNKLIAMAQDFPEDKHDFKVQKDERTFAQNLVPVAGVDYIVMRSVSGSSIGPARYGRCGNVQSARSRFDRQEVICAFFSRVRTLRKIFPSDI